VVTRLSSFRRLWRAGFGQATNRIEQQEDQLEAMQLRRSAAVYAPSALLADRVSRALGIDVRVIEPPFLFVTEADRARALPASLTPEGYGLFFGALSRLKGCDRIVRVLPALLDAHPDFRFVFVGKVLPDQSGQPYDALIAERLASHRDRVTVLPEVGHDALLPLVAGARVVVLPSRVDNLPNTCLEAMALGRVVVGTRDASFEQVITDGESGLLVAQDDDAGLGAAMSRVWTMAAEERARMGAGARRRIERMSPAAAAANLVALFEEVLRGSGRRRG
jgi:glycosyltransferase involved in cell wall biosynthesis